MSHKTLAPFAAAFILAPLLLCACAATKAATPTPAGSAAAAVHWSYEGEEGPLHWGSLSPDYAACSAGASQSPIDLSNPAMQDVANIAFHYQPSNVSIINNGHTIQVNYAAGSYMELDGVRYDLTQFHFHAPSEHAVSARLAAAEIHLVHTSSDGRLAVVGLLVDAGAHNAAFDSFWSSLPAAPGPAQQLTTQVNAAALLPPVQLTYRYAGSLTTPPCTEGVTWSVMVQPIHMSEAQLATFTQIIDGNNRPVQPRNGRSVIQDNTP
jgi:carbonic anhydrase